jgi:hypothetical protein
LRAKPLDFMGHHAANSDGTQRFSDFLKLEGFYRCDDKFQIVLAFL